MLQCCGGLRLLSLICLLKGPNEFPKVPESRPMWLLLDCVLAEPDLLTAESRGGVGGGFKHIPQA